MQGNHPYRIAAISYPLGAMKFYPASLKYMGAKKKQYEHMFKASDQNGGSIELTVGRTIQYHFPLEKRNEFDITMHPKPAWKDQNKYTDIMKQGDKTKKQ